MAELSTLPPAQLQPVPENWIEQIFTRMAGMYGRKFSDAWDGANLSAVKSVWAEGLAGYSPDEIRRGLAECLKRDWPPTLPEFLKMCRPAMDYEAAYVEAWQQIVKRKHGKDKWSHPAIFWAAAELGSDLTSYAYDRIRARWRIALDGALAKVISGELPSIVPQPAPALPASTPCSKEEAAANVARLKSLISS